MELQEEAPRRADRLRTPQGMNEGEVTHHATLAHVLLSSSGARLALEDLADAAHVRSAAIVFYPGPCRGGVP